MDRLMTPPVVGVPLTPAARKRIEARLRKAFPELLSEKTRLIFPPGWTWVAAAALTELARSVQDPAERRALFPVVAIESSYESALSVILQIHAPGPGAIVQMYKERSERTCGRCGAQGA